MAKTTRKTAGWGERGGPGVVGKSRPFMAPPHGRGSGPVSARAWEDPRGRLVVSSPPSALRHEAGSAPCADWPRAVRHVVASGATHEMRLWRYVSRGRGGDGLAIVVHGVGLIGEPGYRGADTLFSTSKCSQQYPWIVTDLRKRCQPDVVLPSQLWLQGQRLSIRLNISPPCGQTSNLYRQI